MMILNKTKEIIERTLFNIDYIDDHQTDAGPFAVTERINGCISLLLLPHSEFRGEFDEQKKRTALAKIKPEFTQWVGETIDTGDLVYHLRNAVAHGRFYFLGTLDGEIESVRFEDARTYNASVNWRIDIQVGEMTTFMKNVGSFWLGLLSEQ